MFNTASNLSFGQFDTNGVGANVSSIPAGETFTLNFTQTDPTVATFTDNATITGQIVSNGSNVHVQFATTSFTIGSDIFTIAQPPGGFLVVSPNNNNGITTINGAVTQSGAPEPSTMLLLGGGFISLAFLKRKRRA